MIRNTSDLLTHFGLDSVEAVSRAIYKNTECGAWAKALEPGKRKTGTRTETWTAKICWSIVGPVPVSIRKSHGKRLYYRDFPDYIRQFLLMNLDQAPTIGMTWEALKDLEAGSHGVLRVNKVSDTTIYVTFEVQAPVLKTHKGGIQIGSIVEGSDAEVGPVDLFFPFSSEDLDHVIGDIEYQVDVLWREANLDDDETDAYL